MTWIHKQIELGTDDAYEREGTGMFLAEDYVFYGDIDTTKYGGTRFQNIIIPVGATIVTAYMEYYPYFTDTGGFNSWFYAEDGANPGTFTSVNNNMSARTPTTTTVPFTGPPVWTANVWINGPELKTIIQELVDSYDYSAGAAIVIINEYDLLTTPERAFHSYESNPDLAAKLHIEYTAGTTSYGPIIQVI